MLKPVFGAVAAILLSVSAYYWVSDNPGASAPVAPPAGGATTDASDPDASAREAVREMAGFLERAPESVVHQLAGSAPSESIGAAAPPPQVEDATQAGIDRVEEAERSIAARYPANEAGSLIRRYVALALTDTDSDQRPDLNRARLMNDLMQEPGATVQALQAAIAAVPAAAEVERSALVKLAVYVAGNEQALPAVENLLISEIGRRSPASEGVPAPNVVELVDSYTMLVTDPGKRAAFVQTGLETQEDPHVRRLLEDYLRSAVQ